MNIFGFILPSLLIFAFAFGLYRGIRNGWGSRVASALLAIGALGFVGAALFPCSPGCDLATSASHLQAGAIDVGLFLAPFVFWRSLKKDNRWRGYGTYSLVTGVVVLLLFIAISPRLQDRGTDSGRDSSLGSSSCGYWSWPSISSAFPSGLWPRATSRTNENPFLTLTFDQSRDWTSQALLMRLMNNDPPADEQ